MRDRGTILVVEDEQLVFDSVELFLEDLHDLTYASNGTKGLEMARSERVDLILLDIGLPDINGYELCRMLKNDPETAHLPIIFLTGFSSPGDEAAGLEAGAVDYIVKPINAPILRARVQTHMVLKLQRDYLELLIREDALTSLINRRGFDEILAREWRRAARAGKPLSLIMIDVDAFKPYNDNYGHVAGDECLRKVADSLSSVLHRGGDHLFRYGGEEFAALLAETPFDFVELMADRLRTAVEAAQLPHAYSGVKNVVTVSAGAATVIPHHSQDASTLVVEADRMLYKSKGAGRNLAQVIDLGGGEGGSPLKTASN